MKPFIVGGPVLKTAEMLRDGTRELYFYGVTFGQIGVGVFVSKARKLTPRAADSAFCICAQPFIFKNGVCQQCGLPRRR